jgi:hypothetical protein
MQPPYPPAIQPKNGLGIAGFVVGLVGLLFSFIPIIGVVAWPMVIIGLVLSIVGVARANKGEATNKGLAIAGVACSLVGLAMCILYAAAFGKAVNDAATQLPTAPPVVSEQQAAVPGAPTGSANPATPGRAVVFSITTSGNTNISYGADFQNKNELIEGAKTWKQEFTVAPNGHSFLSIAANPVEAKLGKDVSCTITVDGKVRQTMTNPFGAFCTLNLDPAG